MAGLGTGGRMFHVPSLLSFPGCREHHASSSPLENPLEAGLALTKRHDGLFLVALSISGDVLGARVWKVGALDLLGLIGFIGS